MGILERWQQACENLQPLALHVAATLARHATHLELDKNARVATRGIANAPRASVVPTRLDSTTAAAAVFANYLIPSEFYPAPFFHEFPQPGPGLFGKAARKIQYVAGILAGILRVASENFRGSLLIFRVG